MSSNPQNRYLNMVLHYNSLFHQNYAQTHILTMQCGLLHICVAHLMCIISHGESQCSTQLCTFHGDFFAPLSSSRTQNASVIVCDLAVIANRTWDAGLLHMCRYRYTGGTGEWRGEWVEMCKCESNSVRTEQPRKLANLFEMWMFALSGVCRWKVCVSVWDRRRHISSDLQIPDDGIKKLHLNVS